MSEAGKPPPGTAGAGDAAAGLRAMLGRAWGFCRSIPFSRLQQATIAFLLVVLCIYASLKIDEFFTWTNIVDSLFTNAAALGVMALGMTFVMIAGGFDLSVASTTAVCSVVLVMTMDALSPHGAAVAISVALALTALVGIGLGAVNGVLVAYVGVNPFVVTLSTMFIFRGIALVVTGGGQSKQVADIDLRNLFTWVYDRRFAVFGGPGQVVTIALVALGVYGLWRLARRFTRFAGPAEVPRRARILLAAGGVAVAVLVFLLLRWTFDPERSLQRFDTLDAALAAGKKRCQTCFEAGGRAIAPRVAGPLVSERAGKHVHTPSCAHTKRILQGCSVSMPIVIFAVILAAGTYLLKYTRFGHYVFAIGGNEQAAWLAGVRTRLVKTVTYMLCGFACAVAAAIFVAMTSTAQPEGHRGKELNVIASVIVGGTPLGGGSGGLFATLTGVLLLRVIENLLTHFRVGSEYRPIVTGGIIIVVVAIDVLARRRSRR